MPVRLVTTQSDAVSAHALVIRMCEECGYPERPSTAAFTKMLLNNPDDVAFLLATDGTKPIGIAMLTKVFSPYLAGPYGLFKALFVVPEYRKSGTADELFKAIRQEGKRRGFLEIQWHVYTSNNASNGFFAKHGFAPEGDPLNEYVLSTKKIRLSAK